MAARIKQRFSRPRSVKHNATEPRSELRPNEEIHILLTGSTGNLGAYILHELLTNPTITHISCLNRSADAENRQIQAHTQRGLNTSFPTTRISFFQADLTKPDFGLTQPTFDSLRRTATHILQNAWPVDFNLTFSSFATSLQGIQNLVTFASTYSDRRVNLLFVSSVSVVGRWGTLPGAQAKVPEVVLEDWRTAKMGYGQSKIVAERMLAEASRKLGVRTTICRVGQVAGPVERGQMGEWNRREWLPALVRSSKFLGMVPETLGPMDRVDWIPVDVCGRCIAELVVARSAEEHETLSRASKLNIGVGRKISALAKPSVYHVQNPHSVSWRELLPLVQKELGGADKIRAVAFTSWVDELEKLASGPKANTDLDQNPAAKLLYFFTELRDKATRFPKARAAFLETTESRLASPALDGLRAVDQDWMKLWMQQWKF